MEVRGQQSGERGGIQPHLYVLVALSTVVIATHAHYFKLPFFWDELGQFVPAALDLFRGGVLVPHSTLPNVHPPGVMGYLALVWKITGYSVAATRVAMLALASLGVYTAFLLAIRMCRDVPGAPAFSVALLLYVTPLFYMQAMMAQLDMPAMVFTALALLLFLDGRIFWCAAACTALVLIKETGLIAPVLFAGWLVLREKRFRDACWFAAPAIALALWLILLKSSTGFWLGNAEFGQYNVEYSLSPVRILLALLRRGWFLFFADFRWIASAAIIMALRRTRIFFTREWALLAAFVVTHVAAVSLLGGATLERYLLPVFPILYIAAATAFSTLPTRSRRIATAALALGLFAGLFWNPPYPFPYENNLAMVDFVELEKAAAEYLEREATHTTIASAWPYTRALAVPEFDYVHKPLRVVETSDLHAHSVVDAVKRSDADVLVLYSRSWDPPINLIQLPWIEALLREYYHYEPQITPGEVESRLGMHSRFRFWQRGQWMEVFTR